MATYRNLTVPKPKSKTAKTHRIPTNVVTFLAGALVAIPLTLVALSPSSGQTAPQVRVVQAKTVDDTLSCSQPAVTGGQGGGGGGGAVLGESTTAPLPVGGAGGGNAQQPSSFVQQEVLNASASINNTGPNSNNVIASNQTVENKITNTNNLNITNTNSQSASTGNATVNGNTTGGDATTGDASNQNSTDLSVSVTN